MSEELLKIADGLLTVSEGVRAVVCIDKVEDASAIFRRIQEFKERFFEGSDVTCE